MGSVRGVGQVKSQRLVKRKSYFMQAVCICLSIDCFQNFYGSYIL